MLGLYRNAGVNDAKAERAKIVEDFVQRKREAALNKHRGQADIFGVSGHIQHVQNCNFTKGQILIIKQNSSNGQCYNNCINEYAVLIILPNNKHSNLQIIKSCKSSFIFQIRNTLELIPSCIFYQQNARSYDPTPQQSPNNDQQPGSARNREEQVIITPVCVSPSELMNSYMNSMLYINVIFQDYIEKLRQIRQQNYQERRNVMGKNKNEVKLNVGLISGSSFNY